MSIALKSSIKDKVETDHKPVGTKLSKASKRSRKLGIWGHSGHGKTYAAMGALLAGETLTVASCDFGGSGLDTLEAAILKSGREELLDRVNEVVLSRFDHLYAWCKEPSEFFDYDISDTTVYMIDGFTAAQLIGLDGKLVEKQLGPTPEIKDIVELKDYKDWEKVRMLTVQVLAQFFNLGLGVEKPPAKIITFLQNQKDDTLQNIIQSSGPFVQGSARTLIPASFDICTQAFRDYDKAAKQAVYKYRLRGSDKYAVKLRGRDQLPDIVEADPEALWRCLKDPNAPWGKP